MSECDERIARIEEEYGDSDIRWLIRELRGALQANESMREALVAANEAIIPAAENAAEDAGHEIGLWPLTAIMTRARLVAELREAQQRAEENAKDRERLDWLIDRMSKVKFDRGRIDCEIVKERMSDDLQRAISKEKESSQ